MSRTHLLRVVGGELARRGRRPTGLAGAHLASAVVVNGEGDVRGVVGIFRDTRMGERRTGGS